MADLFKVSQTKVRQYRMCRHAYHRRYWEGLRKRIKSRPLTFGTMIHQMLEAYANGQDPFALLDAVAKKNKKLFADEREMYGNIVEDIRTIMETYFKVYPKSSLRYISYKKTKAEHDIEIDIGDGILFVGKVDHFAQTKNGLRWIVENKTFSVKPTEDQRWRDVQTSMYIRVCEMLGVKNLAGICWNYVRSKAPTRPEVLKDKKSLSRRKIVTLPQTVLSVAKEHSILPEACKDVMAMAEESIPTYFDRVFSPVVPQVVDALFEEFLDTAVEIKELHGEACERNIGQHCAWCDFEPLCRAALTGADVDYVKETEYESRKK